jgi:hypothetical protein
MAKELATKDAGEPVVLAQAAIEYVRLYQGVHVRPGVNMPTSEAAHLNLGASSTTVKSIERDGPSGVRIRLSCGKSLIYPSVSFIQEAGAEPIKAQECPAFIVRKTRTSPIGEEIQEAPGETVTLLSDRDTPPEWVGLKAEVINVLPGANPPLVVVVVQVQEDDPNTPGEKVWVPYRHTTPVSAVQRGK